MFILERNEEMEIEIPTRQQERLYNGPTAGRPSCSENKENKIIFCPACSEQYEEPVTEE
jgi:hypothetical protein